MTITLHASDMAHQGAPLGALQPFIAQPDSLSLNRARSPPESTGCRQPDGCFGPQLSNSWLNVVLAFFMAPGFCFPGLFRHCCSSQIQTSAAITYRTMRARPLSPNRYACTGARAQLNNTSRLADIALLNRSSTNRAGIAKSG